MEEAVTVQLADQQQEDEVPESFPGTDHQQMKQNQE